MTSSTKKIALYLIAALAPGCLGRGQAQMASQAPPGKTQGPVAISALPSGTLVVLGGRGRLSLIDSTTGGVTLLKDSLGYFTPADMAAVRIGDADSIFVALYNTGLRQGLLARYSLTGAQLQTWFGRTAFAGVAIDQVHKTVYLGDAITGEISSLSMDGNSTSPSFLVEVSGVARLGPLATDATGQRLFVADVGGGTIYVVDLSSRKSRLLASGMGEPAALSYDVEQQRLYVADASHHCIWQISTNLPKPTKSIFSSAAELREPRGLTVDAQHTVWVADHAALAVFKLSSVGLVIQRISP
jgi:DNA-binding beta-propeller fold protein YncE